MSTKNIRLEGNGRTEVGKGRTRTDDVWKEKKKKKKKKKWKIWENIRL